MTSVSKRCGLVCLSIALLLSVTTICGQSKDQRSDTQAWNDTQVAFALNKQVDFTLLGTLRLGREVSRPVDERIGFGFTFKAGKYLTFTPSYLYIGTQPLKNQKAYENRLTFAATLRVPIGAGFTLSDRNQFEHRYRHPQIDATRYRNRLQIEHPFKIGATKFNAFVSDEIFYDWSIGAWVRNRAAIGAGHTFNPHFTGEVYYLRQNDSHSRPGDLNVIGTTLRFRIR
jgi:Protein of unknown function (DUF2490)